MKDEMDFKLLFLEGLLESNLARPEFWARHQTESSYSKRGFFIKLGETWEYYSDKFYKEFDLHKVKIPVSEAMVIDFYTPLYLKRGTWGYIGEAQLIAANDSLVEIGKLWNIQTKLTKANEEKGNKNYKKFVTIVEREGIDIANLKKENLESTFNPYGLKLKKGRLYDYQRIYTGKKS